jgi:hypothetical protein
VEERNSKKKGNPRRKAIQEERRSKKKGDPRRKAI